MLGNISEISILVSAILAVAVGSIWYSPFLFGRFISKTTPHIFDDTEESERSFLKNIVFSVCAQILFLVFVSQFVIESGSETASLMHTGAFLLGLLVAHMLSMVILEKKSMVYFLVHAGYTSIILFGGLMILAKWPW